jgi:hypothetical protein
MKPSHDFGFDSLTTSPPSPAALLDHLRTAGVLPADFRERLAEGLHQPLTEFTFFVYAVVFIGNPSRNCIIPANSYWVTMAAFSGRRCSQASRRLGRRGGPSPRSALKFD